MHFSGMMPAADGAEFIKTLTRMASQAPALPGGTYEPFEARCLDALLMLASQARGADRDPDRATAVVHIPVSVLTDNTDDAEFEDGTPLISETARRLLCDARIQVSVDDDNGTVLGIGRTSRTIPAWLARIVRKRDAGCRYPGCARTRWIHIHHIIHWAHDGPTDLDNLISLCLYHHRLVHEDDWRISGDPNGEVAWLRPGGSPFIPGERDWYVAGSAIPMLDDFLVPEHLKQPQVPDTS